MSNAKPEPRMSGPSRPAARAASIAAADGDLRLRVLAADVEVALLDAGRERGDRHRLDDRERVALEEHPILERAGLGLVGVAHEVVRLGGLAGDGGPLASGREGRAAATDEPRGGDLGDDGLAAHLERLRQGRRSRAWPGSRRARLGRRRRSDAAAGAMHRPPAGTRDRWPRGSPPPFEAGDDPGGVDRCRDWRSRPAPPAVVTIAAGARSHSPRHGIGASRAWPSRADSPAGPTRPRGPRRSAPRRRAGRRCRRRRGPRPAAAASSRTARRTWRRRRPRRAARRAAGRCSSAPAG